MRLAHTCALQFPTLPQKVWTFLEPIGIYAKNDLGILNAELALLKYLGPSVVDDDVVFLNSK